MGQSNSLVLFDIDGTLLCGAGQHHKRALVAGIDRVTGITTTLDGVPTSGMLDRDLIAAMLRNCGYSERRIRIGLRKIMSECQDAYLADCAMDLRDKVCPGVVAMLAALQRRGAVMAVVTGNLTQIGWKKLELAGLKPHFATGAFAEDGTTRTRLARVAMRRAIKQGFVNKNCRISLIGDHANDIEAAKRNGFQAVAVASGLSSLEQLRCCEPDILVRDLTELDIERLL